MNNNKNDQHLSAGELAGLPGLPTSVFGVHKRAAACQWPSRQRAGRGGGREYPVSCLPAEAQTALAERAIGARKNNAVEPGRGSGGAGEPAAGAGSTPDHRDHRAEALAVMFDAKSEKLKAEARARLAAVREFHQLLGRGFDRGHVVAAVTREHAISEATLLRHLALVRGAPEQQWLFLLCPAYAGRVATADMSAEAWETLKADYLRAERPTAKACVFRLKRAAAAAGWTLPSVRTMERRLQAIPRAERVYAREGRKAALQLFPAQARSRAGLSALSIINGDGYKHNLWVEFPDGEQRRAQTWFWQDVHSSKILGFRTDKTEHTDVIRLSFGDVVEKYGIPDAALMDNTLAAANKTMSGGVPHRFRFQAKPEEPLGIFPLLGVDVRWATPGHGQAKPIERVFGIGGIGELVDKAPEFAGAWTGGSTLDKPEYSEGRRTPRRAIKLADLEAAIEREIAAFNAKEGRRSPMHRGRSFDAVFAESYAQATIRRATEAQRRLWLLATEPVQANGRDGTITLGAGRVVGERLANRYWHADLVDYAGRKVVARFDPKRLHQGVHVYTIDGRWICYAECVEAKAFDDQDAAREHQRNRKTFLRSTKTALGASLRMDALQVAQRMPDRDGRVAADLTVPAPKVVRGAFRDPLERPRFEPSAAARALDAAEQPFMAEAEAAAAAPLQANVAELRTDPAKHDYWLALDARRAGGEALADADEHFWKAWQQSAFFTIQRDLDQEFEQRRTTGG